MNFTPHFYRIRTLFINILKTLFFFYYLNLETNIMFGCKGDDRKEKKGGRSKGREREEERVVHRRIALIQFL